VARREIVTILCNQCLPREVIGSRFTIEGRKFEACAKHERPLRAYEEIAKKYGERASIALGRRSAVQAAAVQAAAPVPAGRVVCGDCNNDVAKGSKAWHAKAKHGKRAGEIRWSPAAVAAS
jgi:hypothetical protein